MKIGVALRTRGPPITGMRSGDAFPPLTDRSTFVELNFHSNIIAVGIP